MRQRYRRGFTAAVILAGLPESVVYTSYPPYPLYLALVVKMNSNQPALAAVMIWKSRFQNKPILVGLIIYEKDQWTSESKINLTDVRPTSRPQMIYPA